MIQRIQSLYLFAACIAMTFTSLMPLGRFLGGVETFRLTAFGLATEDGAMVIGTIYMAVVLIAATLLPLVTIFFYKKRKVQLRLCIAEMVLLGGSQIFICFYLWRAFRGISGFTPFAFSFSVTSILSIVAFVLVWLAFRAIFKDEVLVKSLDRIR